MEKNKILGDPAFRDQGCVHWPSSPGTMPGSHRACKLGLLYSKGVAVASDIRYGITACMGIGKTR